METIQKNLLKRTKGKFKTKYKLADVYKNYLLNNPPGSDFFITYTDYVKINTLLYSKIFDSILNDSTKVKFPYNLGTISILKAKMHYDRLSVDYKSSMEAGFRVYHLNDHSNGYRFKIRWEKCSAIVKNRKYYALIPTRTHKRELARLIKEGKHDYFTV